MEVTIAYKAECGRKFHTKKACKKHELYCTCWTNPKYKTCKSCKFGKQVKDSNGMESDPQYLETWRQWQCSNPDFKEYMFTSAHKNAPDICINCPVWVNKK